MNTFKIHHGRLENLDDITGYRSYTHDILPHQESSINPGVRDAKYVPLPPLPVKPQMNKRELRPRPCMSLPAPPQSQGSHGETSKRVLRPRGRTSLPVTSQDQRSRLDLSKLPKDAGSNSLGLRAHKDWLPFLLPDEDRHISMETIAQETRRLEASCRRFNKEKKQALKTTTSWVWDKEIPSAAARMSEAMPGVAIWHVGDPSEGIQQSDNAKGKQRASDYDPTTPTQRSVGRYGESYTHPNTSMQERAAQPDPLPSFESFVQQTFAGMEPPKDQGLLGPAMPDGTQASYDRAYARVFPGPLKSREEMQAIIAKRHREL
ncbi:hypothetical protein HRR83_000648 [Exophiala dermatitidis]|uniref:Uncharacterized protein n=1 Tax=Exophiala dermatitidis TaxID=5970 RepID=A0AAN6F4K4_EXODE|nr:hypothetical protein HRR75_000591 [Exophiala dermatitidis]KAJ4527896.1 hypothetical protein HRR74_000651 [Exophiala dermatitidis]KAJ4528530.1 hypothetical protein HRR73_001153 [Exophiala dermatitidis]KAJ4529901.1 hypothetical protein HRR76_009149 [Exophiala dermatitidis]KAJ4552887.1 hypothetical protein HRR78_003146 [Exophiala dermatitidis]